VVLDVDVVLLDVDVEVGAVLVGEHGSVVDVVLLVDELLDGLVVSGSDTYETGSVGTLSPSSPESDGSPPPSDGSAEA
jgi:hypothetical protein